MRFAVSRHAGQFRMTVKNPRSWLLDRRQRYQPLKVPAKGTNHFCAGRLFSPAGEEKVQSSARPLAPQVLWYTSPMKKDRPLRSLPIEGIDLHEVEVQGTGKRATLIAIAADGRSFRFGISDFSLQIAVRGTVNTEVKALDDLTLRVRYSAEIMSLVRAQVDYPGTEDEWDSDVEAFKSGKLMSWALSWISFELVGNDSPAT